MTHCVRWWSSTLQEKGRFGVEPHAKVAIANCCSHLANTNEKRSYQITLVCLFIMIYERINDNDNDKDKTLMYTTNQSQRSPGTAPLKPHLNMTCTDHARRSLSTVGGTHVCRPNRGERSTASRVANQPPHYTVLSFTFIPPRRNGVRSHSRCGTES